MLDQWRLDSLRANGNGILQTPHVDELASRSANFTQACVQAPVCVPSRVSCFTRRYPDSHKNAILIVARQRCKRRASLGATGIRAS